MAGVMVRNGRTSTAGEKFQAALNVIKSLPKNGSYKPSSHMMLKFYSYYKQATEGPCNKSKPWAWDVVNRAKWEAWSKLGQMSKITAMEKYVGNLKLVMTENPPPTDDQIVEAMPAHDNVQDFIQILGNFYEVVELEPPPQFKKYSKLTSTPLKSWEPSLANGHAAGGYKVNGDDGMGDSKSDADDDEGATDTDGHVEDAFMKDKHDVYHQLSTSDGEDIFCDTVEDNQLPDDSPVHSINTVVNTDEGAENLSKSESVSTMSSVIQGEGNQGRDQTTSNASTVQIRGGDLWSTGADGDSLVQAPGTSCFGRIFDDQGSGLTGLDSSPIDPVESSRRPQHPYSEVQSQIAITLLQLQQDMHSVLNRLTMLEALAVGEQARRGPTISGESTASSFGSRHRSKAVASPRRPFTELSHNTLLFIVAWPFAVRWIMRAWSKRQSRG